MRGSYTVVAQELTDRIGIEPPVSRQQVHAWNKRRVKNRQGREFPSPVDEDSRAPSRRPRLFWDIDQVVLWYRGGVPGPDGWGWRN